MSGRLHRLRPQGRLRPPQGRACSPPSTRPWRACTPAAAGASATEPAELDAGRRRRAGRGPSLSDRLAARLNTLALSPAGRARRVLRLHLRAVPGPHAQPASSCARAWRRRRPCDEPGRGRGEPSRSCTCGWRCRRWCPFAAVQQVAHAGRARSATACAIEEAPRDRGLRPAAAAAFPARWWRCWPSSASATWTSARSPSRPPGFDPGDYGDRYGGAARAWPTTSSIRSPRRVSRRPWLPLHPCIAMRVSSNLDTHLEVHPCPQS